MSRITTFQRTQIFPELQILTTSPKNLSIKTPEGPQKGNFKLATSSAFHALSKLWAYSNDESHIDPKASNVFSVQSLREKLAKLEKRLNQISQKIEGNFLFLKYSQGLSKDNYFSVSYENHKNIIKFDQENKSLFKEAENILKEIKKIHAIANNDQSIFIGDSKVLRYHAKLTLGKAKNTLNRMRAYYFTTRSLTQLYPAHQYYEAVMAKKECLRKKEVDAIDPGNSEKTNLECTMDYKTNEEKLKAAIFLIYQANFYYNTAQVNGRSISSVEQRVNFQRETNFVQEYIIYFRSQVMRELEINHQE